jgi:hypothetical protein
VQYGIATDFGSLRRGKQLQGGDEKCLGMRAHFTGWDAGGFASPVNSMLARRRPCCGRFPWLDIGHCPLIR